MAVRVLHVVESLSRRAGCVSISVVDLAVTLGARGGDQYLIARDGGDGGVGVDGVGVCAWGDLDRWLGEVDVVHLHGYAAGSGRDVSLRRVVEKATGAGVGVVFSPLGAMGDGRVSEMGWFARRRLRGIRWLAREASVVTVLNGFEGEQVRSLGAEADRVACLVYGVDVAGYRGWGSGDENDERVLLYLGPVEPAGGIVVLMRVLAGLGPVFDGWRLVVVGDDGGDWVSQLRAGVERKGAGDRVSFVVGADLDVQKEWLGRAEVVVFANMAVRCPVGVGQALASGAEVLSTGLGLPEGEFAGLRRCEADQVSMGRGLSGMLGDVNRGDCDATGTVFDVAVMADVCAGVYERCLEGVS